jgi:hypothetical protein
VEPLSWRSCNNWVFMARMRSGIPDGQCTESGTSAERACRRGSYAVAAAHDP